MGGHGGGFGRVHHRERGDSPCADRDHRHHVLSLLEGDTCRLPTSGAVFELAPFPRLQDVCHRQFAQGIIPPSGIGDDRWR